MNEQLYRMRFSSSWEYRGSIWEVLVRFFQRQIPSSSTILDLGCGWGEFINLVEAHKKYGMDLNPDSLKHLDSEVEFLQQDCSSKWPLENESLDVIFSSNFIEHLPSKNHIEKTFLEAQRCLKKSGLFILMGPNIRYISGQYWDYWDHHVPITDHSLCEVLKMSGFQVERVVDRFLPYTMSGRSRPPVFLLKLYLKFPLLWRLRGHQFLVYAKKNDGVERVAP